MLFPLKDGYCVFSVHLHLCSSFFLKASYFFLAHELFVWLFQGGRGCSLCRSEYRLTIGSRNYEIMYNNWLNLCKCKRLRWWGNVWVVPSSVIKTQDFEAILFLVICNLDLRIFYFESDSSKYISLIQILMALYTDGLPRPYHLQYSRLGGPYTGCDGYWGWTGTIGTREWVRRKTLRKEIDDVGDCLSKDRCTEFKCPKQEHLWAFPNENLWEKTCYAS